MPNDDRTQGSPTRLGEKERARNFRFTMGIGALLLVVGMLLIVFPAYSAIEDAFGFVAHANVYIKGDAEASQPLSSDNFDAVLAAYERARSDLSINRLLGFSIAAAGMTVLISRLVRIDLKTSGLLKLGPAELPVQASGAIAFFFALLVMALVVSIFLGLHSKSSRADFLSQELADLQTSGMKQENEDLKRRLDELRSAVKSFAGNKRVDVEFRVGCPEDTAQSPRRVFHWERVDNELDVPRRGFLKEVINGVAQHDNPSAIQILKQESGGRARPLAFVFGAEASFDVRPFLVESEGKLVVEIKPTRTGSMTLHQYCEQQTEPPDEEEEEGANQ